MLKIMDSWSCPEVKQTIDLILSMSPYKGLQDRIFREVCLVNIPCLLYYSFFLKGIHNNYSKVLFATRDCVHLQRVFSGLFPDIPCDRLYASRLCYRRGSEAYRKYTAATVPDNALIVDMNGSGKSASDFFATTGTRVSLAFLECFYYESEPHHHAYFGKYKAGGPVRCLGGYSECLNYVNFGTLLDFTDDGPLLAPLEYDPLVTAPISHAIDLLMPRLPADLDPNDAHKNIDYLKYHAAKRVLLPHHTTHHVAK